jgi:hypothetical protein
MADLLRQHAGHDQTACGSSISPAAQTPIQIKRKSRQEAAIGGDRHRAEVMVQKLGI